MAGACERFGLLLSAYADGEVNATERSQVDLHLSGCGDCRARLADLRSLSQAVARHLEARAAEVDFSRFADQVMSKLTPDRPSLLERVRVAWGEILAYHRTALVSSFATAAVTIAVAVPLVWKLASSSAGAGGPPVLVLRDLKLDDPNVQPVVMQMGDGKTLIMLVQHPSSPTGTPDVTPDAPKGGDL